VTSGGKRCSKGTPNIKKFNPSLFIKGGTTKEEKTKVLTLQQWPWVPAGLDARSEGAGWLPAVSYCSALLTVQFLSECGDSQQLVSGQISKCEYVKM
jgi:hypothetical protein